MRRGAGSERGVDVVVNYTGGDTWTKSLRVLRVGGRLLTCGATAGYDPKEDIRFIWTFELQDPRLERLGARGCRLRCSIWCRPAGCEAVIDESFPLERAPEALQRLEDRQVFGKLVITP